MVYVRGHTKVAEQAITQTLLTVLHISNQQNEPPRVLLQSEGISHL